MNTVKLTKKDYFNGMIAFLNGDACDIPVADMVAFCDKEIASLDTRAAKAKERAAAKRAEGDDLMDIVLSVLDDTPATRNEVYERVMATGEVSEDVSVAKIGYRLTALTSNEKAVKSEVVATGTDGKQHKYAAYSLA